MEDLGLTILGICAIVFIIILIVALITRKPPEKEPEVISKLKDIYNNGYAIDGSNLIKMLGVPDDNKNEWREFFGIIPDTKWHGLSTSYFLAIAHRYDLKANPISKMEDDSIVLKDGESIYFKHQFELHEIKVQSRNIVYGGMRLSSGMARAGSLTYVASEKKDFAISDIGNLYITNKRIIFIGDHNFKNISILLNSVLSYYLYKDAVIVISSNRKPVLFVSDPIPYNFDKYERDIEPILSDYVYHFMIVLSRILESNQDSKIDIENELLHQ